MKHLLLLLALGVGLAAQSDPCADCNDRTRPWMRGGTEIACTIPAELAKTQAEHPGKNIVACHCQHKCDPFNDMAKETDGRAWDAKCSARCSPNGCTCPHPCES